MIFEGLGEKIKIWLKKIAHTSFKGCAATFC